MKTIQPQKRTFGTKVRDFFRYDLPEWWDIFKNFFNIILIIVVVGAFVYIVFIPNKWKRNANEKEIYRNEKLVIVGTNEAAQDFTHDKFHKPIVIKVWLVQRLKDTTQFAELDSHWDDNCFYITNELWYSKGIGDTLYFDYILKRRFFTINK